MTRQNNHAAYITLNWYDIQEMLEDHHPLILLKIVLQHEAPFNPPTSFELGDQISNAEYLCKILNDIGINANSLKDISADICHLTVGLTTVTDTVVEEIVKLAIEKELIENKKRAGVWRTKGLTDKKIHPIKRSNPIKRGANYADSENKAFPLDTPERVKASHAYIHKYWKNGAKSGITATYSKQKFIDVHSKIMTRMRRLGIDHNMKDSLDTITKKYIKSLAKEKTSRTTSNDLNPDMIDFTKVKKLKNIMSATLSDHIIFMKNYISACDERNDGLATSMASSINTNSRDIVNLLDKHFPGYKPDEVLDREALMKDFMSMWDDYIGSVKALVIGGDTGNDGMARDALRQLLLLKNRAVKYFITTLASVADEDELEKILTRWVTHLQGYIESRDNDDFATSFQHLQDWQQAKDDLVEKLAKWVIDRDIVDHDMSTPRKLDLETLEDDMPPAMGRTTNPPAPLGSPAIKTANRVRRDAHTIDPYEATTASNNLEKTTFSNTVVRKNKTIDVRENAVGHFPYKSECILDVRSGKCYKKH